MKKLKLTVLGALFLISLKGFSQAKNDTFEFTNDKMNYLVNVGINDNRNTGDTIGFFEKLDLNNYSFKVVDSLHILLKDTSVNTYTGQFRYIQFRGSFPIDTILVTFYKSTNGIQTYYNNETNSDSIVNHFDLFQIGVFYNTIGSPRLLNDSGSNFNLYKRAFWNESNAISNASTADINGDGKIDFLDVDGIEKNYLKTSGKYNPKLSPPSSSNKLYANFGKDTLLIDAQNNKIRVPINLHLSTSSSFYGLGYSYTVQYFDSLSKKYLNYSQNSFTKSKPWIKDTILNKSYIDSLNNKRDVLYCKTLKQNEPVGDTMFGIVEVVVDEILIGIPKPGDRTSLIVNVFDIAMIDNNYNFLPISPKSDTVIIINKNKDSIPHASIVYQINSEISVYPTLFNNDIIVRNTKRELLNIKLYDFMGRLIYQEPINNIINHIHIENLNSGIYFLTIDEKNRVFKLVKN